SLRAPRHNAVRAVMLAARGRCSLCRTMLGQPMVEAGWLLFVPASLALILTPGQDMILVMSRSIAQGAAAGVATAAGVSVSLVGHTLLATLGLGAILRT